MSGSRSVAVAMIVVVGLAVGSCSTSAEPYLSQTNEVPVEELWMRPSVDEAAAELDRLLADVRGRWESELGLGGWSAFTDPGRSACGNNPGVAFERRTVSSWSRTGPIPDKDWPRAVEIVTEVGAGYGFGPPQVVVARPGQYHATAFSKTEAEVRFGSQNYATLGARTGCHPTAEALVGRAEGPS